MRNEGDTKFTVCFYKGIVMEAFLSKVASLISGKKVTRPLKSDEFHGFKRVIKLLLKKVSYVDAMGNTLITAINTKCHKQFSHSTFEL